MLEPVYTSDGSLFAELTSEFDGRDPELDRIYYTIRLRDAETYKEIYRTRRHWFADHYDDFQKGMEISELGFSPDGGLLLINRGMTAQNCVPFRRIIIQTNRLLATHRSKLADYYRGRRIDDVEPPVDIENELRRVVGGRGMDHDWTIHLMRELKRRFENA